MRMVGSTDWHPFMHVSFPSLVWIEFGRTIFYCLLICFWHFFLHVLKRSRASCQSTPFSLFSL